MKRRSFFQSIAKAAAIIALAPQIAFRVRPELPTVLPSVDKNMALKQLVNDFFWGRPTSYEEYIHSFNGLVVRDVKAGLLQQVFHVEQKII